MRTQDTRYWVQQECPAADAGHTAYMQLDLNMVDLVTVIRDPQNKTAVVSVTYAGVMEPFRFKGLDAVQFMEKWDGFILVNAADPQAAPGIIQRAGGTGIINR